MSNPSSYKPAPARLIIFRCFAALLLLFSLAGATAVGIGIYITIKNGEIAWIPTMFLFILAITMVLLMAVSIRAFKIGSVDELEEQSKSSTMEQFATWLRK